MIADVVANVADSGTFPKIFCSNYDHWVKAMRGFLKGRKLWYYVTGNVICPIKPIVTKKSKDGTSKSKEDFGRFETAKEVWDRLAKCYTIFNLSYQYQLLKELHSLKQECGQAVFDLLPQMKLIWDQLTSCEPVLKDSTDAKAYKDYRNRTRLIQFFMGLTDDYELVRASLLHQNPLPTLEDAFPPLKYEETHLGLTHPKSETVFAVTCGKDKFCQNCNRSRHSFSDCPSIK
ncbi:uncharacterized protein LOC107611367 [Arachis ipaensis]|uniref:uncharacterized protein LOC107611367 n=1 Tax=Arachis ipaensis TaxID=130454 RepID=UPI0007AF7D1E|nr:uncharacterized protein LOC107611367 [Arachis ipaensis]XP_025670436.1 uncharacterized protein LOC112770265 [Arachis hypogaea]